MFSFNAVRGLQQKKYTSNIFFWRLGSNVINRTGSRDIVGIKVRPHTHTHTQKRSNRNPPKSQRRSAETAEVKTRQGKPIKVIKRSRDQHNTEVWITWINFKAALTARGGKKSLGEIVRRVRFSNSHYSHLPHSDWPETLRGRKERMIDLRVSRELRLKIALFLLVSKKSGNSLQGISNLKLISSRW